MAKKWSPYQKQAQEREMEPEGRHAELEGLDQNDLGRTFQYLDRTFEIIELDYHARPRQHPVIVQRDDGKRFRMTAYMVKGVLQEQDY